MTILRLVGDRSILLVAGILAFIPSLVHAAQSGEDDLARLVQTLDSGDELSLEQALHELSKFGPEARTAVDPICNQLGSSRLLVRSMASDALVAIGPDAIESLTQQLNSPSHGVRATALQTLGRLKAISTETLVRFVDDSSPNVRAAVAIAIRHGGHEDVAEILAKLIRDDESAVVVQACLVLKERQIAPATLVPVLISVLPKKETSAVVMGTLSRYGTDAQSAIPELVARANEIEEKILNYDPTFETMIERIGPPSKSDSKILCDLLEVESLDKTYVIASLLGRMESADESVSNRLRQLAHELIDQGLLIQRKFADADGETAEESDNSWGYFSVAESCTAAYWNVSRDADGFIDLVERIARNVKSRVYFSHDMGPSYPWQTFSESDAGAISRLLTSNDINVVNTAFFAINELGSKADVHTDVLIELLGTHQSDPEWVSPELALRGIGPSAAEKVLPALVTSFQKGKTSLEELADYVAGVQFVNQQCEVILKDGLKSSDSRTVEHCLIALCRTTQNPDETAELLLQMVELRKVSDFDAINALLKLPYIPTSARELLVATLANKNEWMRGQAAEALGKIGPESMASLPEIRLLLSESRFQIRLQAATAIFLITEDHVEFSRQIETEFANRNITTSERMQVVGTILSLGERGEVLHRIVEENLGEIIEYGAVWLCAALESSRCDGSTRFLKQLSKSKDWVARTQATRILKSINDNEKDKAQR